MLLNPDILFDYLSNDLSLEMRGRKKTDLALSRPLFHMDPQEPFKANHLYVSRADKLPAQPHIEDGVVIIVVGENMHLSVYETRCCIIHVTDNTDIFDVFNEAQRVFDRFDAYERSTEKIMRTTANIKQIVDVSSTLIDTPLLVLDAKFNVLAESSQQAGTLLELESLETFLANESLMMQRRDPISISILDKDLLCQNLYSQDEYLGSITFDYNLRRRRMSDTALISFIANIVVEALMQLPRDGSSQLDIKQTLEDLLDGVGISEDRRRGIHRSAMRHEFMCLKIALDADMAALPFAYVCSEIETQYPGSFAFTRNGAIIALVNVSTIIEGTAGSTDPTIGNLEEQLREFAHAVKARVGISDAFNDLMELRMYYDQASAALSGGIAKDSEERVFYFQDYALAQLVSNAFGSTPIEMYLTRGLKRLAAHDEMSSVSYLDTLRVYLNNNMSMTRTAAELFVHRSTLIDRIARIEKELDLDLKDPHDRLRMQIILEGLEIRSSFQD